jgi:hypothetical protein
MFKKILTASLIVLALAVPLTGIALADQHKPQEGGPRRGKGRNFYGGVVTNIDAASSEFSIKNRVGESVTFKVNPDTKFLSRNGELESFDDLAVEMVVGVRAVGNDEGTLVAKAVFYIDPAMLAAERAGGEVIAIGHDNFTITTRNDEELTFQVDENTRFKSRDGSLESLEDLEVGMKVGVLYVESDDGTLLAKAVGSRIKRGPGGRPGGPGKPGEDVPEGARRPSDLNSDQS